MREIKFRAWDGVKMFYPDSLMFNSIGIATSVFQHHNLPDGSDKIISNGGLTKDLRLMQFTGLKDKNGVDIFEGDIVRERQFGQGAHPWVGSIDMFNGFYWLTKLGKEGLSDNSQGFGGASYDPNMVEIIGNIHENPELLDPTPQKGKDNE